jgi:hypothetical protein
MQGTIVGDQMFGQLQDACGVGERGGGGCSSGGVGAGWGRMWGHVQANERVCTRGRGGSTWIGGGELRGVHVWCAGVCVCVCVRVCACVCYVCVRACGDIAAVTR